jgi:hypothetical protein
MDTIIINKNINVNNMEKRKRKPMWIREARLMRISFWRLIFPPY